MKAKQVAELCIRDFTQPEQLDCSPATQTVHASMFSQICTEPEALEQPVYYCFNELLYYFGKQMVLFQERKKQNITFVF